jgi:hypothetical protein
MRASVTARLVAMVSEAGGDLELMDDGRLHLQLPPGNEELVERVRAHKEQLRSLLRNRHNAAKPRKAPQQAPPPPIPAEPVYITPACTCGKYPFAHVHAPEPGPRDVIRFRSGDEMFAALKQLLAADQDTEVEDESVKWFTSSDPNLPADQQRQEWLRTAAFDEVNNIVYLPAGMSGNEDRTFLLARREGAPYIADHGHTYVPAGWLGKQHPNLRDDCEILEQRNRAAASTSK